MPIHSDNGISWTASNHNVSISGATSIVATLTAQAASSSKGDTVLTVTYKFINGKSASATYPITVQKPTYLAQDPNPVTAPEASCNAGNTGQCGTTVTTGWTVYDQLSPANVIAAGMDFYHSISNTGTNTSNLQSYHLTCPTGSAPCGIFTDDVGHFPDTYSICAPACQNPTTKQCQTGCSTIATQQYYVSGFPVRAKTVTYLCNGITIK